MASGFVRPGTRLFGPGRRCEAQVRADGSVVMDGKAGSIHQLGAAAQGLPSCNGWTFWHLEDGEALVPLDTRRVAYREAGGGAV